MTSFSRGERQRLIDTGEALALHLSGVLGLDPPDRPPVEVFIGGKRHIITGYEVNSPLSVAAGQDMLTVICTVRTPSVDPDRTDRALLEFSATGDPLTAECLSYDECE